MEYVIIGVKPCGALTALAVMVRAESDKDVISALPAITSERIVAFRSCMKSSRRLAWVKTCRITEQGYYAQIALDPALRSAEIP